MCRDGEEVGIEGIEAVVSEVEREVLVPSAILNQDEREKIVTHPIDSIARHLPSQTVDVDRPHIIVAQRFPEERKRDRISIGHVTLGRIIPDRTVAEDILFPLGEPAILSEPTLGTGRRRRHLEE